MTDEKNEAPPEPVLTHYERRNNVMLAVFDRGPVQTHTVCKSINEAKKLSVALQKTGAKVKVDKDSLNCNMNRKVRRPKVVTKSQSVKKILCAGPRLTEDEAKALERHLLRSAKER
jgi:hypothetical protein